MAMRKYIVLHHEDMSPSILCIDRIKEISELPGGHSEIRYKGKRTFVVRESPAQIVNERVRRYGR